MARRGVDYGAGTSSAIAAQYADLRQALAAEGEARNKQKAREIEDKGLFGSGIRQSDIADFGNIAIKGAEFGEARMGRKMDRATKSFDRRMAADERRLKTLQQRWKTADPDSRAQITEEMEGIEMGMTEKRNSFEDFMGKYQEKGLWGTSFGGKDVGYRTEGESKWSQAMRPKPGSEPGGGDGEFTTSNFGGGREMGIGSNKFNAPEGGPPDRYSSYPQGREFEKMDYEDEGPQEGGPQLGGAFDRRGEQWSPGVSDSQASGIEGYGPGMMNLGDRGFKKKADSGDIAAATRANPEDTAHMRSRFEQKPSNRYMPGVLRNLTQNQRDRMDVLEKRKLIADKEQALGQNKIEQNQMINEMLAKRRRNKLTEALRETDWN